MNKDLEEAMKRGEKVDNESFTLWHLNPEDSKEAPKAKSDAIVEITEDHLPIYIIICSMNPLLYPVVALKYFLSKTLSTGEIDLQFVIQREFPVNDGPPKETKKVISLKSKELRTEDESVESVRKMVSVMKDEGFVTAVKEHDFRQCKTMDDVITVFERG